jgi:hypothetical protein
MKAEQFAGVVDTLLDEVRGALACKGQDYQGQSADRLANFYEMAALAGTTPLQVWLVLVGKHLSAIKNYAETGVAASQSIHERFMDLATYAVLGDALAQDRKSPPCGPAPEPSLMHDGAYWRRDAFAKLAEELTPAELSILSAAKLSPHPEFDKLAEALGMQHMRPCDLMLALIRRRKESALRPTFDRYWQKHIDTLPPLVRDAWRDLEA